jgi:flagellar basal-body rod protein FlgC
MIEAEDSFQANATVFETGADMWDMLVSIKRD